ncbi:MAG: hypothetical protein AAFX44_01945 [Pseudomonadota bacterium]
MWNKRFIALALLMLSTLAIAGPPKPTESEYLRTTGGMFTTERGGIVRYVMAYEIKESMPPEYVIRVSFENPKKGEPPITDTEKLEVSGSELNVESPPLTCIRPNKKYTVVIELFADEASTESFGRHKQKMEYAVPLQVMKEFGVEIC